MKNVSCGPGQIMGLIKMELCVKPTKQTQSPKEAGSLSFWGALGSFLSQNDTDRKLKIFSQL